MVASIYLVMQLTTLNRNNRVLQKVLLMDVFSLPCTRQTRIIFRFAFVLFFCFVFFFVPFLRRITGDELLLPGV
jgi:hypothetical protein